MGTTVLLWTVTPDGNATSLEEIPIEQNGEGKLTVKAQSQTFALSLLNRITR
jgi:hypothetical protein